MREFLTIPRTRRLASIVVLTILLIGFLDLSSSSALQSSYDNIQSASPTSDTLVAPVKVDTYGKAWNGYLAYGLWQSDPSTLGPVASHVVAMTTDGQVLYHRTSSSPNVYWPVKYIAQDTLMYMGAQQAGLSDSSATHFWNMKTNKTTDFPNVWGHHDIIYNPTTHTFLTFRDYIRVIDGHQVLMDHIYELNSTGGILWTWDTYTNGHFNLNDECPCNDTTATYPTPTAAGQTLIDLTHSNSLQWIFDKNIIYSNMRAQNTFCKIDKTSSRTVWCLGEHGNFTLLDQSGKKVPSLWYHSHDVNEVSPNIFLMFDNDYHNTTKPCQIGNAYDGTSSHSRILEISVNEQTMTARTIWSWTAPSDYWTPYWGSADILPNGDVIAAFGAQTHYVPNTQGAELVEVNPQGQVVRTWTFAYGWGIYRVTEIGLQTNEDYDNAWHTKDFKITLSTVNDIGSLADIYYKINNGLTESVNVDGEPTITTEGSNNTLEYWSVDKIGIEETPHKTLTGIKLDKGPPTILITTPPNGTQIGSSTVTVTWKVSNTSSGVSSYQIRLDSGSFTNVGTNTSQTFSGLSDGRHTIDIRAVDNFGDQATASAAFVVDTIWITYLAIISVVMVLVAIGAVIYHRKSKTKVAGITGLSES
jgi:hypothetical protein